MNIATKSRITYEAHRHTILAAQYTAEAAYELAMCDYKEAVLLMLDAVRCITVAGNCFRILTEERDQ